MGWQDPILGLIVGISMFLSIISAVLISTGFPFVFKKINLDPAIASGPFATMISDVVTVTIYFTIATIIFNFDNMAKCREDYNIINRFHSAKVKDKGLTLMKH
jgi:hypothetical protein